MLVTFRWGEEQDESASRVMDCVPRVGDDVWVSDLNQRPVEGVVWFIDEEPARALILLGGDD